MAGKYPKILQSTRSINYQDHCLPHLKPFKTRATSSSEIDSLVRDKRALLSPNYYKPD